VTYETEYVIAAGLAWIRRTRLGDDEHIWLITFDGEPRAWKEPAGERTLERGELAGVAWSLTWDLLAEPFESPHRVLRRRAASHMLVHPAIAISGRIGDLVLDRAPGHTARLWGTRHARTWGWAHASTADGAWTHVLTATLPGLPRLSQHGRDGRPPGLPLAWGAVEPPRVRVGPYTVEADPGTFVGLRYTDTDGSAIWCYHSERARGLGGGTEAALEIAVREPIPGWRVAL
jgi:hypothetical protein